MNGSMVLFKGIEGHKGLDLVFFSESHTIHQFITKMVISYDHVKCPWQKGKQIHELDVSTARC